MTADTGVNVLYTLIKVHVKEKKYKIAKDWKRKCFLFFFGVNLKYNDLFIFVL